MGTAENSITVRRPPTPSPTGDTRCRWSSASADFGAVADALSLLMPHLEPLAIATVREATTGLDPHSQVPGTAADWIRQEAAHQRAHRRYNDALLENSPALARVDRLIGHITEFLKRRRLRLRLAFTVGFEAVAYSVARWVEPRMATLFVGAEPATASMFLWHLAEEVEHKSVVHDVHVASGGSRAGRLGGGLLALAVVGPLTILGTLTLLAGRGRMLRPGTWGRLVSWSVSFAFSSLTAVGMLAATGHGPADLADPLWYKQYLRGSDPDTGSPMLWSPPGSGCSEPAQGRESSVSNGPLTS